MQVGGLNIYVIGKKQFCAVLPNLLLELEGMEDCTVSAYNVGRHLVHQPINSLHAVCIKKIIIISWYAIYYQ